jgi:hypothetical protein
MQPFTLIPESPGSFWKPFDRWKTTQDYSLIILNGQSSTFYPWETVPGWHLNICPFFRTPNDRISVPRSAIAACMRMDGFEDPKRRQNPVRDPILNRVCWTEDAKDAAWSRNPVVMQKTDSASRGGLTCLHVAASAKVGRSQRSIPSGFSADSSEAGERPCATEFMKG